MHYLSRFILIALIIFWPLEAWGQSLQGSRSSAQKMKSEAEAHDLTFLETPRDIRYFVDLGLLVKLSGNKDYQVLPSVGYPYVRPAVKIFVERLSSQYRRACGEKLVVTSATRPSTNQPKNSSPLSVHPTGMALDLRASQNMDCRRWLERVLLQLEGSGVVEATREYRPPHFHVAVFPRQYTAYVARLTNQPVRYVVRAGDTLSHIARAHKTTVGAIQEANGLRSTVIRIGQTLVIPVR